MDAQSETCGCRCPPDIQIVARCQRITCERLFRYAYEFAGDSGAYSRAIFMRFVSVAEDAQQYKIPLVVRDFMRRVGAIYRGIDPREGEPCNGCMLSPAGVAAVTQLCEMDFPSVTEKTLFHESAKRRTPFVAEKLGDEFSAKDRYWLALIESGAPDEDSSSWDQLVLHEDDES